MTVARKLRELASEKCGNIRAQDVRIGLGYTGVQLEDGRHRGRLHSRQE